MALRGEPTNATLGVLWGAGGYVAFSLAPSLGLPPELPGTFTADLAARQLWWLGTAVASACGLALLVLARSTPLKLLGGFSLALPHLIGAPHPPAIGGAVPPELAAEFAAVSLATPALFWVALGALCGGLYARHRRAGTCRRRCGPSDHSHWCAGAAAAR